MRNVRGMRFAALSAVVVLLAACASAPVPNQEIQAAQQALNRAQNTEIPLEGQVDLNRAREKLAAAERAVEDKDNERALRLAEQARADAELAVAKAESHRAKQSAEEMQRSIQSLQQEIQHGTGGR